LEELEDFTKSTWEPIVLNYEKLRGLLDPGPWDCAYCIDYLEYGIGHGPHPTSVVTTRAGVEVVRTEGNYPSSTRVGLLSSYLTKIFM
jgi:hypothetical protein